jgi:hypothetical protein
MIAIRLVVVMAHAMVCDVTSPSLTSPDFQACVRSASPGSPLSPGGSGVPVLFRLCSGWVGVPSGFPPWGFPPLPRRVPRREFFFAFTLHWRLACVSDAATRRIALLFSRETFLPLSVCRHTDTHTDTHTDKWTDRQIMVHATPHQGGRGGESVAHHTTPCHAMPHHATTPQWCRPLQFSGRSGLASMINN